ncbi:MAG TPA: hypothetical protein VFW71_11315 [Actinomycetota bacterium]|nr:hypothetical protein [Actinomycetota bacterium]
MTEAHDHVHGDTCAHHAQEATSCGCEHDAAGAQGDLCGAEAGACCGGHGTDLFAFPVTDEVVSVPAVQLAGLLDLCEKLAADVSVLSGEVDYLEAQRALEDQAPRLVVLRAQFLDRMRTLLAEVAGAQS